VTSSASPETPGSGRMLPRSSRRRSGGSGAGRAVMARSERTGRTTTTPAPGRSTARGKEHGRALPDLVVRGDDGGVLPSPGHRLPAGGRAAPGSWWRATGARLFGISGARFQTQRLMPVTFLKHLARRLDHPLVRLLAVQLAPDVRRSAGRLSHPPTGSGAPPTAARTAGPVRQPAPLEKPSPPGRVLRWRRAGALQTRPGEGMAPDRSRGIFSFSPSSRPPPCLQTRPAARPPSPARSSSR